MGKIKGWTKINNRRWENINSNIYIEILDAEISSHSEYGGGFSDSMVIIYGLNKDFKKYFMSTNDAIKFCINYMKSHPFGKNLNVRGFGSLSRYKNY